MEEFKKVLILYNRIMVVVNGFMFLLICFRDKRYFLGISIFIICYFLSKIRIQKKNLYEVLLYDETEKIELKIKIRAYDENEIRKMVEVNFPYEIFKMKIKEIKKIN